MTPTVTVHWIAEPQSQDGGQARALRSWALAHDVAIALPRDEALRDVRIRLAAPDGRLADDVEKWLDRARDAIAARDADAADLALSSAESALRAHPDLPQGAWLMAEVERTRAARWRRIAPPDEEAAARAWLRAETLDGGRTPGLGEEVASGHAAAAEIVLHTVPDGAIAWLDGVALKDPSSGVPTFAGPHVLVVTLEGSPVWARWIDLPAARSVVAVAAPGIVPCSASDLARASLVGGTVHAEPVRCEEWIAVAPGASDEAIRVARCGRGKCGFLLEWGASPAWSWMPPPEADSRGRETAGGAWPAWATWGIVVAGAAVVASVVLVASGVFQPAATETRFVSGGIRSQ